MEVNGFRFTGARSQSFTLGTEIFWEFCILDSSLNVASVLQSGSVQTDNWNYLFPDLLTFSLIEVSFPATDLVVGTNYGIILTPTIYESASSADLHACCLGAYGNPGTPFNVPLWGGRSKHDQYPWGSYDYTDSVNMQLLGGSTVIAGNAGILPITSLGNPWLLRSSEQCRYRNVFILQTAYNPTPEDEAEDVDSGLPTLTWDCDGAPDSYKVYFGEFFLGEPDYNLVGTTTNKFISIEDEFVNQGETYGWYVVAVYGDAEVESEHWTFTTDLLYQVLAPAINPTPATTTTGLSPSSLQLEWENYSTGGGVTFNVYLDDALIAADVSKGTAEEFSVGSAGLKYGQTYEWYVVSKRAGSTVKSAVWTFSTKALGGVPVPTGENAVARKRRLIAAAADKIWYEDID